MLPSKNITIRETREHIPYHTPEWAKHVVWYQIFPERFRNGDPSNDPTAERIGAPEGWEVSSWTGDWYERADWERELGPDFRDGVFYRRYGGDIQGIIDKLDYLQDLGIGAIYLNPVFDAKSLHKYDASAYRHVDRFFGPDPEGDVKIMNREDPNDPSTWEWTSADRLFLELIEKVHARGMKIIIDGVFNHTGTDFWAFRDIREHQSRSDFKEWYDIISFDDGATPDTSEFAYHGWWGVKDLPEFKGVDHTLVKPVREHIFAITRRWMDPNGDGDPSDGVDGWRLDVVEEVGQNFWKKWHELVRNINPDAFTVAEIWTDNAVNYINAEQFNSVMNYRFAMAVQDFMIDRDISTTEFSSRLDTIRESYPEEANYVMQNLMDSHDTPRLASMIVNPGRKYDQWGKPKDGFKVRKPTDQERKVQKLVSILQFTYVGAPMIYYGTEAGMWGADDPDDRKPMVWPEMNFKTEKAHPYGEERPADQIEFNRELYNWYKKLVEIRNHHRELRTGEYKPLLTDDENQVFAFARYDNEGLTITVLNRSEESRTISLSLEELPQTSPRFTDLLSDETYETTEENLLKIDLNPVTGRVLSSR